MATGGVDQEALDAMIAAGCLRGIDTAPGCVIEQAAGLSAEDVSFIATSFAQADLAESGFVRCRFSACSLRGADLTGATFESCRFYDSDADLSCDFSFADMRRTRFEACDLTTATLRRIRAWGIVVKRCQASGASFREADFALGTGGFPNALFEDCNLAYADFSGTDLRECAVTRCRLVHGIWEYASLAGADLRGSALDNIEARGAQFAGADLRGASFNNLDPRIVDLTGARVDADQALLLLTALGIRLD